MNTTDSKEYVPPFYPSPDLPGPDEFPAGPGGERLKAAVLKKRAQEAALKTYARKESPGETLRRIVKASTPKAK